MERGHKERSTMSNESDLQEVEISIEDAREAIANKESLERLTDNPDFIRIIREGYFEKEAIRLVSVKADPEMATDERQKQVLTAMDGIGSLRNYLRVIMILGDNMEQTLKADETTREELLSEQL